MTHTHRGMDVLADLHEIQGTPWLMVAKVDTDEILAEARYRAWVVAGYVGLACLLTVVIAALVYRHRQAAIYRSMFRAERHEREVQERFRTVLYSIGDGVITADQHGRVQQMNPVAERLTGWTEAEAQGKRLREVFRIVDEETHAVIDDPAEAVLRGGSVTSMASQTLLTARDGTERPISDSGAPIRDDGGEVIGVVVVFSDQTEERAARRALRESEAYYRTMVESLPATVCRWKPDTTLTFANQAYVDLIAGEPDVAGRKWLEFVPEGPARDEVEQFYSDLMANPRVFSAEHQTAGADGAVRWFTWTDIPIFDDDGRLVEFQSVGIDITARKQAEESLQHSETLRRVAGRVAKLGAWRVDLAGPSVVWSDEVCAIHDMPLGTSPTLEQGLAFYAPECQDRIRERFDACARDGTPFDDEFVIVTAKGRRVWVRAIGQAVRDENGKFVRVEGALQDISEKKAAESELVRLGAKFTGTLESMTDAFFTLDREWRFTYVNQQAERLLGRNREALVGKVVWGEFPEAAGTELEHAYRRTMEEGARLEFEHYYPPLETWFEIRAFPIEEGVAVYFRDVTAQKHAEAERQARQRRHLRQRDALIALTGHRGIAHEDFETALRKIAITAADTLEVAMVSVWRLNPDGNALVCIEEFDRRTGRHSSGNQLHLADHSAYFRALHTTDIISAGDAHTDPRTSAFSETYLKPRGITSVLDAPIHSGGQPAGVLCLEHDGPQRQWTADETAFAIATASIVALAFEHWERKRAEEERENLYSQLVQAQKLEAVGRLAGGVAHDFNNMLTIILGNAELALSSMDAEHCEAYPELVQIQSAAQRSAELTRQLLAFARKQIINPSVLDLNHTVDGMLKMLRRLIGEHIELVWTPGADLWPVRMDAAQVDQVLVNLTVNARDAITGHGRITIETGMAVFDDAFCDNNLNYVPGEFVVLTVNDNGHGMDRETVARIFEPFFTTKQAGEGSGLGLATVYGIVKQNNGFINVYSEPGQGTSFRIYLPRHVEPAEGAKAVQQAPAAAATEPGGETVLLVEDEEALLRLAERQLRHLGYTVLSASSPEEAIRIAEANAGVIHLLITDVVMPGMSGRALAERILAAKPSIRVLYMSGHPAKVFAHHGLHLEDVHFLQKPFNRDALAAKIREALA